MTRTVVLLAICALGLGLAGCGGQEEATPQAETPAPPESAHAGAEQPAHGPDGAAGAGAHPGAPKAAKVELKGIEPGISGTITFTQEANGIHIVADVSGVKPGKHGFHVHQNGDCTPPFQTAGDHLDPYGVSHGCAADQTRHLGDLGNLEVGADGKGHLDTVIDRISLTDPHHLILGKAVILHAKEDDCKTQPSGNSGDRIACGVIQ